MNEVSGSIQRCAPWVGSRSRAGYSGRALDGRRMRFVVVNDSPQPCPYLPGQHARMPLRLPVERIAPDGFDALLAEGDRRFGPMLYRTQCPSCRACEPIRVPVSRFEPSRSQRRVLRKNDGTIDVRVVRPELTPRHVELFNRHKNERGLSLGEDATDAESYRFHLIETCVDTREIQYLLGTKLVAVSILDLGRTSASSVYHFFDPDHGERALGVYSVLKEIEWCAAQRIEWYYLGLYVRECRSLAYKAQYRPHERRVDGVWREER
jgi:arginine-tRNA-protein transferase